jgi:serine/threonine protein kinase
MNHFVSGKIFSAISGRQYLVKDEIGTGGYGTVFEAIDIHTGEIVAIKIIRFKDMLSDALKHQHSARFLKEIKHCSSLCHPNIVKLLSYGSREDDQQFAVFEYVKGVSLKERIITLKKLPPSDTKKIMYQLLEALQELQLNGIVHGDFKPQNIMLCDENNGINTKLFDFGSSIHIHKKEDIDSLSLPTTVHYSSPEQLRNEIPTYKSDVYAWGLILLECLSGYPAIKGQSLNAVIQNQLSNEPVSIPKGITDNALLDLLNYTLSKDPNKRTDDIVLLKRLMQSINFENIKLEYDHSSPSTYDFLAGETAINKLEIYKAIIGL